MMLKTQMTAGGGELHSHVTNTISLYPSKGKHATTDTDDEEGSVRF